jgi:LacI family transcriptional regulator
MKRATMNDVAHLAGVSKSTVSHVINETRYVEPDTRDRVLKAIEELGYRLSAAARSLTTNRTDTIGVIISDIANPFFGEVVRGIEGIMGPADYGLILCNTDEVLEREAHYLNLLLRQRVDGIIAAATSHKWEVLEQASVQNMPLVFLDRTFDGIKYLPFVGVDNQRGAYIGTKHLIEGGTRRLGIVAGFQRLSTMRDRLAGFHQALEEYNLCLPDEWIALSRLSVEDGRKAATQILSLPNRPDGLLISNNYLSLGTLLALQDLGLQCPDDISLVGFDDPSWAAVSCPPLTVVRQPSTRLGQTAAQIMLDLINGKQVPEPQVMLDCELVVRQSCCFDL